MAHARRMFFDALENDPARSEYALAQFGLLCDIERKAKINRFLHQSSRAEADRSCSSFTKF